ncbi:MAG: hypothetical protein AMXMBFR13_19840 [Phycisphaerae bacterium]|jgi:hypothetical protein
MRKRLLLALFLVVPCLMGGACTDFRNAIVDAFDTFARSALDASLDVFFDQLRGDEFN